MSERKTRYNFIQLFRVAPRTAQLMVIFGGLLDILLILFVLIGPMIAPYDPLEMSYDTLMPPSGKYWMGTDNLGRDLLSRLIVGSRYSLGISLIAVGFSITVGLILGSASGFFGGTLDRILMLLMDALYIFPSFIYVLIMVVVLGPGIWQTAFAISIGRIPYNFRLIRSLTISVKERGFVEAERVLGADNWHIIRHHIAPYYISILLVTLSLGMARGTLAISGLGFLGLGVPPPTPEWGTDLASGRTYLLSGAWWLVIFPGVFVLIAMLGFNLLSEGLDTVMNPTVRRLK
jgi:peptide/nickel transport system permease protein